MSKVLLSWTVKLVLFFNLLLNIAMNFLFDFLSLRFFIKSVMILLNSWIFEDEQNSLLVHVLIENDYSLFINKVKCICTKIFIDELYFLNPNNKKRLHYPNPLQILRGLEIGDISFNMLQLIKLCIVYFFVMLDGIVTWYFSSSISYNWPLGQVVNEILRFV